MIVSPMREPVIIPFPFWRGVSFPAEKTMNAAPRMKIATQTAVAETKNALMRLPRSVTLLMQAIPGQQTPMKNVGLACAEARSGARNIPQAVMIRKLFLTLIMAGSYHLTHLRLGERMSPF